MRRPRQIPVRTSLRKLLPTVPTRGSLSVWLEGESRASNNTAVTAKPRVRDSLVLRLVLRKKSAAPRLVSDEARVR
jgi:hypothetical protein